MSEAEKQGPFLKTALVLWGLALVGGLAILPYVATLEHDVLKQAADRLHVPVWQVLALSMAQTAVLLAVAVLAGLWASRKLALETPIVTAFLSNSAAPKGASLTLLLAFATGIAMGIGLVALDAKVFAPLPSVQVLIKAATTGAAHPSALQGFLASFYGAIDEEILMRLGLMSLLALFFRTVQRLGSTDRADPLPQAAFWTANIATAVLFGLGHLPATAALAPLTPALIVRAIVLNGGVGIVFGWFYRRFGLEWAMVSHFGVDIVAHVVAG
jgi:hypothetical protein